MTEANLAALIDRFLARTAYEPDTARLPFELDDKVIGSVTHADAQLIATQVAGVQLSDDALQILPVCSPDGPAVLQAIANALHAAGRVRHWRNELLPVCADDGTVLGAIERACVRVLGIRTFAVHLIGECHPQDRIDSAQHYTVWLQRRAENKAVDPGLLDTLAGGLVGMADEHRMESLALGLQREVTEEAGLLASDYDKPKAVRTWRLSCPVPEGYMVEDCTVYRAQLVAGKNPMNQDGEVSGFVRCSRLALLDLIHRNQLTYTASAAALLALQDHDLPLES